MLNSRVEDINFFSKRTIRFGEKLFTADTPLILAIVNLTQDSFYEKSRFSANSQLLLQVEKHLNDGADIIDLGAFSTRPGHKNISLEDEKKQLIPAIEQIRKEFGDVLISVDTFRGDVAQEALDRGVQIINDISGFDFDPQLLNVIQKYKPAYILMHRKGDLSSMHHTYTYDSIFKEVALYFSKKKKILLEHGVTEIILDPGFGFSKKGEQNFDLLKATPHFAFLGLPILVGISRKSMIRTKLNIELEESLNGTTILNTLALLKGAKFLRVHDVREAKEIIKLLT